MPRFMYGFPANIVGKYCCQPSVIELPMKTTRFSLFIGGGSLALASRYFARFDQSVRSCCSVGCATEIEAAIAVRQSARGRVVMREAGGGRREAGGGRSYC